MTNKIIAFLFVFIVSLGEILFSQNVGINPTGAAPNSSAGLDVDFTNKGLLIPRVSLTSTTDVFTITSPATSLLVYNTNAAMTGGSVGYWYWNGTSWVQSIGPTGPTGSTGPAGSANISGTTNYLIKFTGATTGGSSLIYDNGTNVGIATATPAASAALDITSTTSGFLPPRMTTAQRNAIGSPALGLIIFNTSTNCLETYIGTTWQSIYCGCTIPSAPTANAASSIAQTSFTANWTTSAGATTYYLDVATDIGFTAFVYNNVNAGAGTSYNVTALTCNTTYYYRVRSNNSCGTSGNSNTITQATSSCVCVPGATPVSFTTVGSTTWTVPPGVGCIKIEAWGAQGSGASGGLGGYATGWKIVTSGQTLTINVGGSSGGGTGGTVGTSTNTNGCPAYCGGTGGSGYNGGAKSNVLIGATELLTGGGGGGQGGGAGGGSGSTGGAGGSPNGGNGGSNPTSSGAGASGGSGGAGNGGNGTDGLLMTCANSNGKGAIGSTGGAAGTDCFSQPVSAGTNGSGTTGGTGGGNSGPSGYCSGGVGGGGGGGGTGFTNGSGGGGGGSGGNPSTWSFGAAGGGGGAGGTQGANYTLGMDSNTSNSNGVRSGNGQVIITY